MGVVWAGRDEVLARAVAIKEVTPPHGLTDEQRVHLRERTLREARAAARINSRAAVTVYDVVEEDGRPWIVMELLPPRTLADVLREEGPLAEEAAARVGLRVLDALSAAHGAGVLHRDVKPANVLYDSTGQAVLTDFGIASLDGDPSMTTTGTIIGSPGYVAPERALGQSPSPASDLWSLGVLLATAVHGRSPFERDSPLATLVAGLHEPLPKWASEGPLGPVLVGLLAKDPKERPDLATVRALLERSATSSAPATARMAPAADDAERTQALSLPALPAVIRVADASPPAPAPPMFPPAPPAGIPPRARPRVTESAPPVTGDHAYQPVAAPAPASAPNPTPSQAPPRRRSRALAAALVIAALTMVGVVALLLLDPGNGDGSASDTTTAGDTTTSGTDDGSGSDTSTDSGPGGDTETTDPGDTPATTPEDNSGSGNGESEDPDAPVTPDGYQVFRDSEYKVALPEGWTVTEESDTRKVYSDPETGRYLLLEEGGEPNGDPYRDWVRQERDYWRYNIPGYELVGIERVDYRDFEAADWEFTRDSDYGRMHIRNRAVVDGDQAFALYWAAPVEDWEASQAVFDEIAASFEPLG
jgi:hypothetical protein